MDPRDEMEPGSVGDAGAGLLRATDGLPGRVRPRAERAVFRVRVPGRGGGEDEEIFWPEAERLRELALALQGVLAQQEERNALCDEFLDLCSMHGECNPGERKLARAFLERIERGEVGAQPEKKGRLW